MPNEERDEPRPIQAAGIFATTHWSVVLAAGQIQDETAHAALDKLCEIYRAPILAFARNLGLDPEDAEDLTQSFFAHFIRDSVPGKVERRQGVKFRSFLLRCFKNFVAHERERNLAKKRGGGQPPAALDEATTENSAKLPQPADEMTAERIYERAWASALLEQVLHRLEADYRQRGKQSLFDKLQPFLLDRKTELSHAKVARDLGMSEEAVRKEVSRMRHRYREIFREEIAHTVTSPAEIEEEMRHLFAVICR